MDSQKFKVIFTGKLKDGFDIDDVASQFAIKFKQPPEKALKILQANKEITLIKQTEHKKAYSIKTALETLGLNIRLERVNLLEPKKAVENPLAETEGSNPGDSQAKPSLNNTHTLTLEPIKTKEQSPKPEQQYEHSQPQSQLPSSNPLNKDTTTKESSSNPLGDIVKKIGAWVAGGLAVIFVLLKKFGLLKLLKIGGIVAVTAFAGYNPEEMCMGNERCEDAVSDQFDACWDANNMDNYDWDNMSDDTYYALQPMIERDFVGCFIYHDTNERIFHSPLDLRIDLMDNCDVVGKKGCIEQVEPQINSCYESHNIGDIVSADTKDFYQVVDNNQRQYQSYMSCFLDENGAKMFQLVLDNWDYYYSEESYY